MISAATYKGICSRKVIAGVDLIGAVWASQRLKNWGMSSSRVLCLVFPEDYHTLEARVLYVAKIKPYLSFAQIDWRTT